MSSPHAREQVLRFVRVSALALVVQVAASGGRVSWPSLWALAAGTAEAALRQACPTAPVERVTSVLEPSPRHSRDMS